MQESIDFVQVRPGATSMICRNDRFALRPEVGWVWLQRLCLFFLRKIGAYAFDVEQTYDRMVVKPDRLLSGILTQKHELMLTYHREGERLLMGPEEFCRLQEDACPQKVWTPLDFTIPYRWYDRGEKRVFGLNITVVPWMNGVLVLPRET